MKKLDKRLISDAKKFVPKEGQRDLLSSNKESHRCPSLGINPNTVPESVALEYLASILVKAFLDKKENKHDKSNGTKTCGNVCTSVNQRTS